MARLLRRDPKVETMSAADDARAEQVSNRRFNQHVAETSPPFFRSIRVRLTAWYALILVVILVALGLVLRTFLLRSFDQDVDSRLSNAAIEMSDLVNVSYRLRGGTVDDAGNIRFETAQEAVPELQNVETIVFSGLWTGVFDLKGRLLEDFRGLGGVAEVPEQIQQSLGDAQVFGLTQARYVIIEIDGTENRVFASPLVVKDSQTKIGTVVIGEPLASRERMLTQINNVLQLAGLTGVILATVGGWLIAGRALAPVERITTTAASIANSDGVVHLSRRLEVPRSADELSRLSLVFNSMLERIEMAFTAQQRFVGDASHELRTPLTSVRGNVDVLLRQLRNGRQPSSADLIEALSDVQRESGRMGRLISDLLVLARTDASSLGSLLKPELHSLHELGKQAVHTATALIGEQHLVLECADSAPIYCDGDRIVQVMLILIDNALRYTPPDGTVTMRIIREVDPEDGLPCARIDVADTGPGIPEEFLPHLFERFYRVEDSRNRDLGGTGLGLSIAIAIVRGHRGWIDVETSVAVGSTFTVWLPISEEPFPGGTEDTMPASGDPVMLLI